MRRNFFIKIEYDGSRYNGWQKQGNTQNTIQEKFENMLTRMFGTETEIFGAGRTDKGVHAEGQTANFHADTELSSEEIMRSMNRYLPEDIAVVEIAEKDPRFHARLNAKGKTYEYVIMTKEFKSALYGRYRWRIEDDLNLDLMKKFAKGFVGTHDFHKLSDVGKTKKSTVRTIDSIEVINNGNLISIRVTGSGFLYHMVRKIVMAMVMAGRGELNADDSLKILEGNTVLPKILPAPACGLCLKKVYY